jgi:NADPH-dependent 2,4-dienoyl-CoA reductase/sulfur reductase-like enzyme/rhodanese-related sulfurtransferase
MTNLPMDNAFLRVLSHQLKSPVGSIQSMLKTVADGFAGEINPQALHFIEKAIGKAAEANTLITDLLTYQVSTKQEPVAREQLDIVSLMDTLVSKYSGTAAERSILLRLIAPERLAILIHGDSKGLEIALRNLIENAMKYTPANGQVIVRLTVIKKQKNVVVTFADSGYGIAKDDLHHIFDPFYRSSRIKATIAGTGLGLAITRNIIANHGGSIEVSSRESKGTTVKVSLPYLHLTTRNAEGSKRKKIVIIGGVTAGPKAAARLRRLDEDLDITIIEKSEFLSYAGCGLPSYIAGRVISPKALMSTADNTIRDVHFFEAIKNIRVLNTTLALGIDRKNKTVCIQDLATQRTRDLPYDILILATGADSFLPPIPGIRLPGVYSLHRIEDAEAIKQEFTKKNARDVCIIGGGLIGVETAESLIQAGARVTILEKQSHMLSNILDEDFSAKIVNEMSKKGTKVLTEISIKKIIKRRGQLVVVTDQKDFYTDFVILSAGVRPNSALAKKAGLTLSGIGAVKVNQHLQTSDRHIYAIGDCAETVNYVTKKHEYWPLGSISTKMGRIAADNICGKPEVFNGFIGTTMFKHFDMNVARTGLTCAGAARHGFDTVCAVVTGLDKAHYYKNAELVTLKVVADRKTQVVLGAAGFGKGDVVRHISVMAAAITGGMRLGDVFTLDLGYAPPYNSPIDLVQTACLFLKSKIEGFVRTISIDRIAQDEKTHLIDVSPFTEHIMNTIPGSINIPLETLRTEGVPFDKKDKCILYSKTSSRAYEAYRYLITQGFTGMHVLEGGYVYWAQ